MRRRILLLVAGVSTLVVLAFAVPVGILLNSAVQQRVEHATVDQAEAVALYLHNSTLTVTEITAYVSSVSNSTGRPTSVILPGGVVIGSTPNLGHGVGPGGGPDGGGPAGPDGGAPNGAPQATLHPFAGGEVAEAVVQTQTSQQQATAEVSVFASNNALHAGVGRWWALLIGGSVALLLLGVLAGELLTRRIVRPLTRTAQTAHQISAGDTTARAPTSGPREIAEVGTALNRLADRIDELIAEERETVADLSHRLRTPLTALRLDAETLSDPAEAERLGTHVSALERTLTAVIHAARRPQREGRIPSCDATQVVAERVRFWSALAEDQGRVSVVDLPSQQLLVRAASDDLAAALDALLENVFAHTPEGVSFAVRLVDGDDAVRLEVGDDGPGLPADSLVRGRSDRGSSGLGLDIARRCAQAGGGSMQMGATATGGALITLLLIHSSASPRARQVHTTT